VIERTFSIIKPDAVRKGFTGAILAEIEKAGFISLPSRGSPSPRRRPRDFMPCTQASRFLKGSASSCLPAAGSVGSGKENAVADLRTLMGATNPANAAEGTIRKKFAESMSQNAIHGSDAAETAALKSAIGSPDTKLL